MRLNDIEVRILGCLIEKSITTPEYYPMSPNAVMNACNQKSSREPVVSYDETAVFRGLFSLRDKGCAWEKGEAGSRVTKFAHRLETIGKFSPAETAVMCLLFLRGPQTPGEIKTRAGRLYEFSNLAEVESTLNGLMVREPVFVKLLPRQTGHKEQRYAHMVGGEPSATPVLGTPVVAAPPPSFLEDRISALEKQVAELTKVVSELKPPPTI